MADVQPPGPHVLALGARVPAVKAVLCVAGVAPADAPDLDFLAGQGQDSTKTSQPAPPPQTRKVKVTDAAQQTSTNGTPRSPAKRP